MDAHRCKNALWYDNTDLWCDNTDLWCNNPDLWWKEQPPPCKVRRIAEKGRSSVSVQLSEDTVT